MRKTRLRGIDKLNWLKEQQDILTSSKRYEVVGYKGIPLNIQRQGFNPSHVASQKRTRAEKIDEPDSNPGQRVYR